MGIPGLTEVAKTTSGCIVAPPRSHAKMGSQAADAKSVAERLNAAQKMREKINAMLVAKGMLPKNAVQSPIQSREVTINDSLNRTILTKRTTHEMISKQTNVAVTVRGQYIPPGSRPPLGTKKLYLYLQGSSTEDLEKAEGIIRKILNAGSASNSARNKSKKPKPPGFSFPKTLGSSKIASEITRKVAVRLTVNYCKTVGYPLLDKLKGPQDGYLKHIEQTSGASVVLRGDGTGVAAGEGLHFFISAPKDSASAVSAVNSAEQLANNLLQTIHKDFSVVTSSAPAKANPAPAPAPNSVSAPAHSAPATAPGLAQSTAPGLAQSTAPGLAQSTAPGLTQATAPGLAQATAPGLAQRTAPGLAQRTAPGLAQRTAPGLAQATAPGLSRAAAPGLAPAAAPGVAPPMAPGLAPPTGPGLAPRSIAPGHAAPSQPPGIGSQPGRAGPYPGQYNHFQGVPNGHGPYGYNPGYNRPPQQQNFYGNAYGRGYDGGYGGYGGGYGGGYQQRPPGGPYGGYQYGPPNTVPQKFNAAPPPPYNGPPIENGIPDSKESNDSRDRDRNRDHDRDRGRRRPRDRDRRRRDRSRSSSRSPSPPRRKRFSEGPVKRKFSEDAPPKKRSFSEEAPKRRAFTEESAKSDTGKRFKFTTPPPPPPAAPQEEKKPPPPPPLPDTQTKAVITEKLQNMEKGEWVSTGLGRLVHYGDSDDEGEDNVEVILIDKDGNRFRNKRKRSGTKKTVGFLTASIVYKSLRASGKSIDESAFEALKELSPADRKLIPPMTNTLKETEGALNSLI